MRLPPISRPVRYVAGVAILLLCFRGLWSLAGGWTGSEGASFTRVQKGDLVLEADIAGVLEAEESESFGPPPVTSIRQFQISLMATEGEAVKAGTPVLGFDSTNLKRQLEQKCAESETAHQEVSKKETQLALEQKDDALALAESEAALRKAKLSLEVPPEVERANVLREARLELERAEKSTGSLKERMALRARAGGADISILKTKASQVDAKVRELEKAIDSMTLKAPRDGIVVYVANWRGEKKKIGDSCWRMEKVMEIPDLNHMVAKGELDEADAGKIRQGQKVVLKLDAHPDLEFPAKIRSIQQTVQEKSWRNSEKVVRLDVDLLRVDTQRMRPGMRFRGKVETGRIPGILMVPAEAVFPTAEGPVVFRKGATGLKEISIVAGERNEKVIQVVSGLQEGDLVSLLNPKKEKGEGR